MGVAESDPQGESKITAFRRRLQALGLTGRNVRIAYRWAGGEVNQLRAFARELVTFHPQAVLASTTPAVAALAEETRTIPIVSCERRSGSASAIPKAAGVAQPIDPRRTCRRPEPWQQSDDCHMPKSSASAYAGLSVGVSRHQLGAGG
jgi:hypothetical protein